MNISIALILAILIGILIIMHFGIVLNRIDEHVSKIYTKIQISEALLTRIHNKMENSNNP